MGNLKKEEEKKKKEIMPYIKKINRIAEIPGPKISDYFGPKIKVKNQKEEPEIIWLPSPDKENQRAPLSAGLATPPRNRRPLGPHNHWVETPSCQGSPFK